MHTVIYTEATAFDILAQEWDDLHLRSMNAPFFMRYSYQRTWWQLLGNDDRDGPVWDRLYLCSLPHNSITYKELADSARARGCQVRVRQQDVCPVINCIGKNTRSRVARWPATK